MEEEKVVGQCKERRFISHGGDIWGFSRKYNVPLEEVLSSADPSIFLGLHLKPLKLSNSMRNS